MTNDEMFDAIVSGDQQFNEQYFNAPQQRALLADVNTGSYVFGRATGKSEGVGAPKLAAWAECMPRGAIGVVCRTFMQAADRTLPPLYRAWERMGYYPNVHYWVQKKPPAALNIKKPYYAPDTDEHAIYWHTGAYFSIISQDRPGSANGKTLDAIYGDEAKLLIKSRFDSEITKASRGNVREFSDYAGHGGTLFLTDMPTTPESKWILDNEFHNDMFIRKWGHRYKMSDLVALICRYQLHVNQLKYKQYQTPRSNTVLRANLHRQIRSGERMLNDLRMETAQYAEASSLENAHFIGIKKLKMWKRDDLDVDFRTQVLNERLYLAENGFYPHFDLDTHCYDHFDYSEIDTAGGLWLPEGVRKGSQNDGDVIKSKPIDVGMDAGDRINCLVAGQEHPEVFKFLKAFYAKKPALLTEPVREFCEYYAKHPRKEVNFYYDHTFVGTDGTRTLSKADMIRKEFIRHGWKVNMVNIGQQPLHDTRYRMWQVVFKENDPRMKPVRFNRDNCKQLLICIQCAGSLQDKQGTAKDKRPEKRKSFKAEEATHFTDAMDTLYIGRMRNKQGYAPVRTTALFGD